MDLAGQPGDWVCGGGGGGAGAGGSSTGCGNVNFSRRPQCNRCGRRRLPPSASPQVAVVGAAVGQPSTATATATSASASASASASVSASASAVATGGASVAAAGTGLGATGAAGSGSSGIEIGKCAADKSRGLFAADDWQCAKCANVNWARRLTCNVCNAPKFGEVEARTGYGGGYNERGVVEYRPRRDSDDDDYDEFGRVKKRKRKDSAPQVCGTRRHLGSLSDTSVASPPVPSRLPQRLMPESTHGNSLDMTATVSVRRDRFSTVRKKRKRSILSVENVARNDKDAVPDKKSSLRNDSTEKIHFPAKPHVENGYDSKYKHFHRDFGDSSKYQPYSRDCIMENRVTSTNEVKYRFKGKTVDEDFEVTYTLQERIQVAAWAIVYQNCSVSANMFQQNYDKPAPDFKTIFAWRQRLLTTGCLVDSHINVETSGRETSDGLFRKRRRRRYLKSTTGKNANSSDDGYSDAARAKERRHVRKSLNEEYLSFDRSSNSDSESFRNKSCDNRVKGRNTQKNIDSNKVLVIDGSSDNDREPSRNKQCDNKSEDDTNSETKRFLINENNNTNGSVGRSSTSGAKRSVIDESKRSDCYLTENARSETPEIMVTRVELARMKSPVRVISPETQFQEDNYFETANQHKANPESSFIIPNVPKQSKPAKTTPDIVPNCMLEDIVSESEIYSSEGGFDSDIDINYKNKDSTAQNSKSSPFKNLRDTLYSPRELSTNQKKMDAIELPLPKFGLHKAVIVDTLHSSAVDVDKGCSKNLSSAMKRIIESMSNRSEEKNSCNIEYIPTKIHPAMAKRNHLLFKDDSMADNANDLWPESNSNSANVSEKKITESAVCASRAKIDDYLPDEDALYRNASDHQTDDEVLRTPPRAPDIGSISRKNVVDDGDANGDGDGTSKLNSLLNLNFAGINTDGLALALQSIQNMSATKEKDNNEVDNTHSINDTNQETPLKKSVNIPFLDDMFYPGSPSRDFTNDKNANSPKNDNEDLTDDLLETGELKKSSPSAISRFKSFAIPKPIMLNRLRGLQQPKGSKTDIIEDTKVKSGKKRKKKKEAEDNNGHKDAGASRLYDDEEDEESGDEGDLSKYDLWGSDEENNDKQEEKSAEKEKPPPEKIDKDMSKSEISQRRKPSKSPVPETGNHRRSDRSGSASSRRSSSSSSSSATSSGKAPRNKAGSRESSSARSRSPVYDRGRDRDKRRSRSREKTKDKSRENRDRDRNRSRDNRDLNKSRDRDTRDKGRDRDRQRHHYSGTHPNRGSGYTRGRAR
ncbi:uncharacterized protein LOC143909505 isoform X2 [Arctopsyche grandis]|uniref:uncharacterized protein LOC143909505 isoform X2 n=1 Tax=Arctopsyche grandis TaxID=121162 RepID=UPI00406D78D6